IATGTGGTILHYDGSRWKTIYSAADKGLYGIWGRSPDNIFAVGASGTLVHFDGERWRQLDSKTRENLADVWGKREKVFMVGGLGTIREFTY
ncbi:MAG: hypothetical protein R3211_07130, partial [Balneolaceae bacterium]|nr:hypothetical protein [Balneolaceae bacterium]